MGECELQMARDASVGLTDLTVDLCLAVLAQTVRDGPPGWKMEAELHIIPGSEQQHVCFHPRGLLMFRHTKCLVTFPNSLKCKRGIFRKLI